MYQNIVPESKLLLAIRNNDTSAFEKLISQYWLYLYRYSFKKLNSHQAASEITRQLFVELWEIRSTMSAEFNLQSFFYERLRKKVTNSLYCHLQQDTAEFENSSFLINDFSEENLRTASSPVLDKFKPLKESVTSFQSFEENLTGYYRPGTWRDQSKSPLNNFLVMFRKTFL